MKEEYREKARQWFVSKIAPICPSCQKITTFSIVEHIIEPNIANDNRSVFSGLVLPMIILTCDNCFNNRLFSAVLMGIYSPSDIHQLPNTSPASPASDV